MIARREHFWNYHPAKVRRTRVVRVIQQSTRGARRVGPIRCMRLQKVGKRFLLRRSLIADRTRNQSRDAIHNHRRAEFASTQHVVADGQLAVGQVLTYAFVDSFITATNQNDSLEAGKFAGYALVESLALRREQNY